MKFKGIVKDALKAWDSITNFSKYKENQFEPFHNAIARYKDYQ